MDNGAPRHQRPLQFTIAGLLTLTTLAALGLSVGRIIGFERLWGGFLRLRLLFGPLAEYVAVAIMMGGIVAPILAMLLWLVAKRWIPAGRVVLPVILMVSLVAANVWLVFLLGTQERLPKMIPTYAILWTPQFAVWTAAWAFVAWNEKEMP